VNGKERQKGDIADLIWNIPENNSEASGIDRGADRMWSSV